MTRNLTWALLLPVLLVVSGCATSKYISTWTAPDATQVDPAPGSKLVAVVVEADENRRRRHERTLAAELTSRGYEGVAAYMLLDADELQNEDAAKAAFEQAGAVGVIAMRVAAVDVERTRTPATYYSGPAYGGYWGGYYGYGWRTVYAPGYLSEETIVEIETLVYDLEQNKLLWAGTSETTNPDDAAALIERLVKMAANEMKKAGLLAR